MFAIAVLAPGLGALISGLFGRVLGDTGARAVSIALMLVSAICGSLSFFAVPMTMHLHLLDWVQAGAFRATWSLRDDTLSGAMVAMVSFVSLLVHVYSIGYMGHEERPVFRFFSYLSFFTFAMLLLASSDNLVQLFFGWEGVGLASYLLIGYWYDKPSANAAAIKAFVFNRVADLFFMVGIALTFLVFGTVDYSRIFATVATHRNDVYHLAGFATPTLELVAFLLFIGAMGKSAQLGFQPWLVDAMEGPTPVSALIHAATMVTAGVFLVARFSPLFVDAPVALGFVAFIGGTTCCFAALNGLVQPDIKRVIAWSTCSQLGYMFLGCGVGAFNAGMFHLFTHAFFKSLLFLSAGSVIHALGGEQDLFRMGGLRRHLPVTYVVFWCGGLALAGIPPFAGFWSKDAILAAAYSAGTWVGYYGWLLGSVTAGLTAFYTFRLIFKAFHGKSNVAREVARHVHESPLDMLGPLVLLACGAVGAGMLLDRFFVGADAVQFWAGSIVLPHRLDDATGLIALVPTAFATTGLLIAAWFYLLAPGIPVRLATQFGFLYRLFLNAWYFDAFYDAVVVRPFRILAEGLWRVGDRGIIDAASNGVARAALGGSVQVVRIQTGSIAVYAFTMLIGLVILLSTLLLAGT